MSSRAVILLLLWTAMAMAGGPTVEDPAAALVRRLGDRDPLRRQIAAARLLALGPKAWPALEPAACSDDPEVSSQARRILRAWAWIPRDLRAVLGEDRRHALLGADPEARKAAAEFLRTEAGDPGRRALAYLFAAGPATFRIEAATSRRTYFDVTPQVLFRLRNASTHPGWAPPRLGLPALVEWRPFGRPVTFPASRARHVARRRFLSQRGRPVVVDRTTVVAETEWVAPGALARAPWRVVLAAPAPGVATFTVGKIAGVHRAGRALPHMEDDKLLSIVNRLPCDIPLDLVARRVTYNLLPAEAMWGVAIDGARVEARREAGHLVVRLSSDFATRAPADFGSVWYVALDRHGEVAAHGPLPGIDGGPREYAAEDLVPVPRARDALERAFSLPETGAEAVRLVVGAAFSRGRRAAGYTAVAKPIDLP